MPRLTEARAQRAAPPSSGQLFIRCSEVKGFCARITAKGARSWVVDVFRDGKLKRITLGTVGVMRFEGPPEEPGARDLAIAAIAAANRGGDMVEAIGKKKRDMRGLPTLNDIWKDYEEAGYPKLRGTGRKAKTTVDSDSNRWKHLVQPTLGKKVAETIDDAEISRWMNKIETQGQRSQGLTLVKSILKWGRTNGSAATQTISLVPTKSKLMQNFYTLDEREKLDAAAAELAEEMPHRITVFTAIRLLLRTGGRSNEIFSAKWRMLDRDIKAIILKRDKGNGDEGRFILLTDDDLALIDALPNDGSGWLFPSPDAECGHLTTVQKPMDQVCKRAGVVRHRVHDLRHSFVSAQIKKGVSLYVAGKNVGHRQATTTQRYAHLEVSTQREAIERAAIIGKPKNSEDKPKDEGLLEAAE